MIVVHHLDYSRSTRVLWLLEELALPYELVRYTRAPGAAAPPALKRIHPLGKSPVIVDSELVLAESSAILRYVDARYGGSRFTPADYARRGLHDEWIDYVEGSLGFPLIATLMGGGALPREMSGKLAGSLERDWQHIGTTLERAPYLLGNQLTLADMQMVYILDVARSVGMLSAHPGIEEYLTRLKELPALQQALAKGGPMAP